MQASCMFIYAGIRVNEDARSYSRTSSRHKSRREIIMQKMHQQDYDLICRMRK